MLNIYIYIYIYIYIFLLLWNEKVGTKLWRTLDGKLRCLHSSGHKEAIFWWFCMEDDTIIIIKKIIKYCIAVIKEQNKLSGYYINTTERS